MDKQDLEESELNMFKVLKESWLEGLDELRPKPTVIEDEDEDEDEDES